MTLDLTSGRTDLEAIKENKPTQINNEVDKMKQTNLDMFVGKKVNSVVEYNGRTIIELVDDDFEKPTASSFTDGEMLDLLMDAYRNYNFKGSDVYKYTGIRETSWRKWSQRVFGLQFCTELRPLIMKQLGFDDFEIKRKEWEDSPQLTDDELMEIVNRLIDEEGITEPDDFEERIGLTAQCLRRRIKAITGLPTRKYAIKRLIENKWA